MIRKIKKIEFNDKIAILLSAILGAVVFVLLYGTYSLDVTNDAWILHQYDGTDTMQHYAGWAQYRISDWKFPLGYANALAYGDGTYITYTDSIPYVAIILKLFRNVLPTTFQFFGWFSLLCYVLQGVAACLLIKRKYPSYVKVLLGDVFFLTAPVLIERTFKHTALSAQWLILFAIYYYLEYRAQKEEVKLPWQMILLASLTIGIHPYFLPMVMIFVLLVVIEACIKKYSYLKIVGYSLMSVVCPFVLGVIIGALGNGVKNTRSGYGYFGFNLNALINPQSASGFKWSHVLEERGLALDTYEGFNYLGLGLIVLAIISAVLVIIELFAKKETFFSVKLLIKRNLPLMSCMLFMAVFAMTNNITWDNSVVLSIPLPGKLIELASIFRSSGRMFWPVYYIIIISLLYYVYHALDEKKGIILLAVLLFVQIYDMRDVYQERYERMKEKSEEETLSQLEGLKGIKDKEVLVVIGEQNFEVQRVLAVWAAEHDMGVAYNIANTGEYPNAQLYTNWFFESMHQGIMRDDVVYVTFEEEIMEQWREALADDDYMVYQRGFYYFVYKD